MSTHTVIAVDLGAESGRVMEINFDGERLTQDEHHRFPNVPIPVHHTLYWDVLRLWHEIQTGIAKGADRAASIGVDSWGVDFALLDRNGRLLADPVHYRDARTDGMMEWVFERIPRRTVFEQTGIQFMQLNTLYQIASLVKNQSPLLDAADTYLTLPTDPAAVEPRERIAFEFEEGELELAFVRWLNLLLSHAADRNLVLGRFALERAGDRWQGSAWGEPWREGLERGTGVKGATLTMLCVTQDGGLWDARCVVDV